jgi:hypothetical protein
MFRSLSAVLEFRHRGDFLEDWRKIHAKVGKPLPSFIPASRTVPYTALRAIRI